MATDNNFTKQNAENNSTCSQNNQFGENKQDECTGSLAQEITEINMQCDHILEEYQVYENRIHAIKFSQACVEAGTGLIAASRTALDQFLSNTVNASTKDCYMQGLTTYTKDIEEAVMIYQRQNSHAVNEYQNLINNSTICKQICSDVTASTTCDGIVHKPKECNDTGSNAGKLVTNATNQHNITRNKRSTSDVATSGAIVEQTANITSDAEVTVSNRRIQAIRMDHAYDICNKPQHKSNITERLDHDYFTRDSPRFLKRKLLSVSEKLLLNAKRRKVALQRIRRLEDAVSSLSDVVTKHSNIN
jgi:hypothetical protein